MSDDKSGPTDERQREDIYDPERYRGQKYFYDILDIREKRFASPEALMERLKWPSDNKWADFCALVDFLRHTEEKSVRRFVYKSLATVRGALLDQFVWYNTIDVDALKKHNASMGPRRPMRFSNKQVGQRFVVFDIRAANFCALRHMSMLSQLDDAERPRRLGFTEETAAMRDALAQASWEQWLRACVPCYDQTSESREKHISSLGPLHDVPACFYKSKKMRVVFLSVLSDLEHIWAALNTDLLVHVDSVCKQIAGMENRITWGSDEIAVRVDDWQQANELCQKLAACTDVALHHRTQMLTVEAIKKANCAAVLLRYKEPNQNPEMACQSVQCTSGDTSTPLTVGTPTGSHNVRVYGASQERYWDLCKQFSAI